VNRSTDKASVRSNSRYKPRYPGGDEEKRRKLYMKRKHIRIFFKHFLCVLRVNILTTCKIATGFVIFVTEVVGN